jgi:Fur family peroxide stress response transcriptional regulator
MIKISTEELASIFKKHGLKLTTQRLAIYKLLFSRKDHPTADQIYHALKKDYPTISLGTIYMTLHLLNELGLVQELGFNEGSIRYDPDMQPHINMVCLKCGKIHDYKAEKVRSFWKELMNELNITSKGQRIDVYYECDECSTKKLND